MVAEICRIRELQIVPRARGTYRRDKIMSSPYPFPIPPAVNPVRRYPLPRLPAPPTPLSPKTPIAALRIALGFTVLWAFPDKATRTPRGRKS